MNFVASTAKRLKLAWDIAVKYADRRVTTQPASDLNNATEKFMRQYQEYLDFLKNFDLLFKRHGANNLFTKQYNAFNQMYRELSKEYKELEKKIRYGITDEIDRFYAIYDKYTR